VIVEDEAITSLYIKSMLEKHNYQVTGTVATGADAVNNITENTPDLVLMDILLDGDLDGIDAARQILEHCDVPIIYLTANADPTTIKRANDTHHYGYLLKPIDHIQLDSIISTAIKRHQLESASND
jgi:CheY-like chemotaxis protein